MFTLPGGMIAPLLDAIHRQEGVELVTMHHEQGVAFAADGYARSGSLPGVGLVTNGPGATNTLTGIASAYLDSTPAIFILGQVQSYLLKGDRPVRQFALQECDVAKMAEPVTKAVWRARSAAELPALLEDALAEATGGRPGPVVIELPFDVQTGAVGDGAEPAAVERPPFTDRAAAEELLDALEQAERPVALLGGGVRLARAADRCRAFLARAGLPAAASMTALDVLPGDDPLRLGLSGMYGNRWVNLALAEADLVLALGCKLDFGSVGADVVAWARSRRVFQVDLDPGEMRRARAITAIEADLGAFLDVMLEHDRVGGLAGRPAWRDRIDELRRAWPDTGELAGCEGVNPNVLARQLSDASPDAAAFVLDVGQHAWWTCQSIQPRPGQRIVIAHGLGACGCGLPTAIGVAVQCRRPVVAVAGDGAFQFNIQELQTVVRSRLPIKIVVVDNACHGSVRQFQERAFGGSYPSTVIGYDAPDFARVAEAYGIASMAVSDPGEVADALGWMWSDPEAPALLRVTVPTELCVYPSVPFGSPLHAMDSIGGERRAVVEEPV